MYLVLSHVTLLTLSFYFSSFCHSFAESIVKCIWKPVARGCPEELMSKMVEALKHFLPPTCLLENITDNDDDYPIDYLTDFSMDYFDGTEATDGVEYTTEP